MSLLGAVPQDASNMRCGRESRKRNKRILFGAFTHEHEQQMNEQKKLPHTHRESVKHGGSKATVETRDTILFEDVLEQCAY